MEPITVNGGNVEYNKDLGDIPLEIDTYNPGVPPSATKVPLRKLREDAFFAAAVDDPKNLKQKYQEIYDRLHRIGNHEDIDNINAEEKNKREAELQGRALDVAYSPTMTPQDKVPIIQQFQRDAQKDVSPKDAYLRQAAASLPEGVEPPEGFKKPPMEIGITGGTASKIDDYINPALDVVKAVGAIGAGMLYSVPAGYFGLYQAIVDKDPAAGAEVIKAIQGAAYMPRDEGAKETMKTIGHYAEKLSIPAEWIADKTFELTGSPALSTAALIGLDPLNYIPLGVALGGRAAMKSYLKAKFPHLGEVDHLFEPAMDKTRVPNGETMWFDKSKPIGQVSQVSREKAAELSTYAVGSRELAEAAGTSPAGIIYTSLLSKTDPNLRAMYPDIFDHLADLDRKFIQEMDAGHVSPFLFDVAAIGKDVAMHRSIIAAQSEVTPMMASSYLEPTGRAFRGRILYGKDANNGFTDIVEAMDAAEMLEKRIKDKYREVEKAGGTPAPLYSPKVTLVENKLADGTSEYVLKWNFNRLYDPAVDTRLGSSAKFGPFDVTGFADTAIGKIFYSPATRLRNWMTAGPARATMNATKLEKLWGDTIRNDILDVKPRQELAQAIYEGEKQGKEFTVPELRDMHPDMPNKEFKQLVKGYNSYRRLTKHMYTTINDIYRTQKVTSGFEGLYDSEGKYLGNLGKPVERKAGYTNEDGEWIQGNRILTGNDGMEAEVVYDFTKVKTKDPKTGEDVITDVGSVNAATLNDSHVVYKLDKPYVKDGQVFEFGIGMNPGKVPDMLLPDIKGYFPHINTEHYFVKAIPRELTINGRKLPAKGEKGYQEVAHLYDQNATTVGVARTLKSGQKYANSFTKKNKDNSFEYVVAAEKMEVDDNMRTAMEMVQYAQDLSKHRKHDRLTLPDGELGRLEDPAVALEKRMMQAARLYAWKDLDFQFRKEFTNAYGELFRDGKFPQTVHDLQLPMNTRTDAQEKLLKKAINDFEQYSKQQTTKDTLLDAPFRSMFLTVGRLMEEVTPDSWANAVRGLAKGHADKITSSLVKLTTFKYIHLSPIRQWAVQPAQLYELHALALSGGNTLFSRDMVNLAPALFAHVMFKDSALIPAAVKKYFSETGHVMTGYSKKELDRILAAFDATGIPNSIDLNAIVNGVFKSASDKLDVGDAVHAMERTKSVARGVTNIPKQVGYNAAEMMNSIGMFLYARSEFIKKFPKAKWDDPSNLEKIASKAWGVGNQMQTRADLFAYQEGSMRVLMQFMAYSNKAIMQPLNSKFLTKSEKLRLGTIRALAFGTDGVLAGPMVLDKIKSAYYGSEGQKDKTPGEIKEISPVDRMFQLAERGLNDAIVNGVLRMMFDNHNPDSPKTDLMLTAGLSPMGGSTTGVPIGDLIFDMMEVGSQDAKIMAKLPFLQMANATLETWKTMMVLTSMKKYETMSDPEIVGYLAKAGEWSAGYSNVVKGLAMMHQESIVGKHGNSMHIAATSVEAIAKFAGISSYKDEAFYAINRDQALLRKEIQNSATEIINMLGAVEDVYDPRSKMYNTLTIEEKIKYEGDKTDRINHLVNLWDDGAGKKQELLAEVQRQNDMRDKMFKEGSGLAAPIQRMAERYKLQKFDPDRREMAEIMKRLSESGDKTLVDQIKQVFIDAGDMK